MICTGCQTENQAGANFCHHCGASLRLRSSHGRRWIGIVAGLFLLGGVAVYCLELFLGGSTVTPGADMASSRALQVSEAWKVQSTAAPPSAFDSPESVPVETKVKTGVVVIVDIAENPIAQITVPVLADGWVALPVRICLGGYRWFFEDGQKTVWPISGGIAEDQAEIGLWRIFANQKLEGPELRPWREDKPIDWLSLSPEDPPRPVPIIEPSDQGMFVTFFLSEEFRHTGLLTQDDAVVGWTFPGSALGGFLWKGEEGRYLVENLSVDEYYRLTFANTREEAFVMALAMQEETFALDRLAALANAFRIDSRFSAQDLPAHLRAESIIAHMRVLIAKLVQDGYARDAADAVDTDILRAAADVDLLLDVVLAARASYGHEHAMQRIEEIMDDMTTAQADQTVRLEQFHRKLYQDWISALLADEDIAGAGQAFAAAAEYFPEEPEILLLGVQVALADHDWAEAERLLFMREYPASLRDSVKVLEARIAELKALEGKIVIRFSPGSRQVPLEAYLDGRIQQRFIVDTGASMVTVPLAAVAALGLTVDSSKPLRRVQTASGVKYAREVVLPSIELQGWVVNQVPALVLDMPNQPDLGLLGLNYLQNFRVDLNTDEGILVLEPR